MPPVGKAWRADIPSECRLLVLTSLSPACLERDGRESEGKMGARRTVLRVDKDRGGDLGKLVLLSVTGL